MLRLRRTLQRNIERIDGTLGHGIDTRLPTLRRTHAVHYHDPMAHRIRLYPVRSLLLRRSALRRRAAHRRTCGRKTQQGSQKQLQISVHTPIDNLFGRDKYKKNPAKSKKYADKF